MRKRGLILMELILSALIIVIIAVLLISTLREPQNRLFDSGVVLRVGDRDFKSNENALDKINPIRIPFDQESVNAFCNPNQLPTLIRIHKFDAHMRQFGYRVQEFAPNQENYCFELECGWYDIWFFMKMSNGDIITYSHNHLDVHQVIKVIN